MPEFEVSFTSKMIVAVGLCIVIPLIIYGYYLDSKDNKKRKKES